MAKNQFLWCHVFNLVMIEVTVFHLFWEVIDYFDIFALPWVVSMTAHVNAVIEAHDYHVWL